MSDKKIDYKKLQTELTEVLAALQTVDLDVDEVMKLYERGIVITKELQSYLKDAENKVSKIKADFS